LIYINANATYWFKLFHQIAFRLVAVETPSEQAVHRRDTGHGIPNGMRPRHVRVLMKGLA
jgi:hypothetical protein